MLQPIIYEQGNSLLYSLILYFTDPNFVLKVIPEIIEEIQPVIHRTIHESHIVKKQQIVSTLTPFYLT